MTKEKLNKYEYVGPFTRCYACARTLDDKWVHLNRKGEELYEPLPAKFVGNFVNGFAKTQAFNGLWGYIDKKGKYLIEPVFLEAHDFVDNGEHLIKPVCIGAHDFIEYACAGRRALVKTGFNKFRIINTKGEFL